MTHEVRTLTQTVNDRFDNLEQLLALRSGISPDELLESLVDFFVADNIPISILDTPPYRALLCRLVPAIAWFLPRSHNLRAAILRRALDLHNSVTAQTSGCRFVSLMADGVRKAGRIWLGICLVTTNHLFFWRLVHEMDQRASTIAATLADTINDLTKRGFAVGHRRVPALLA
jgi:hypothetical protein